MRNCRLTADGAVEKNGVEENGGSEKIKREIAGHGIKHKSEI